MKTYGKRSRKIFYKLLDMIHKQLRIFEKGEGGLVSHEGADAALALVKNTLSARPEATATASHDLGLAAQWGTLEGNEGKGRMNKQYR